MRQIRLYNTLTQQKEVFSPIKSGQVGIYSCGPTVYDYPHIGNYRSFLLSDVLHRVLQYFGYQVKLVMNLTDIDDKTIQGAIRKQKKLGEYTQVYEQAFFEDLKALNFLPAYGYPKATQHIPQVVEMIKTLLAKGYAYQAEGSIYFKVSSFPEYGKLSKINLAEQLAGAGGRIDHDEYDKENVSDFVLWKNYQNDDGEIFYETELGKGRPGWHIECSAMSKAYLGKHFDIHTGGVDNRFPHHENEIAQSECAHNHPYVNYWLHVSHLLVEGEKMSKSAGNFFTLRDLLKKNISPLTFRYMMISVHYRNQYNFTQEGIEAANKALGRIGNFLEVWERVSKSFPEMDSLSSENEGSRDNVLLAKEKMFFDYLADDLNVSGALGVFFEYITHSHKLLHNLDKIDVQELRVMKSFLVAVDKCLGVIPFPNAKEEAKEAKEEVPPNLLELLKQRNQARKDKDFARADSLRDQIMKEGYKIIDTLSGSELKKR